MTLSGCVMEFARSRGNGALVRALVGGQPYLIRAARTASSGRIWARLTGVENHSRPGLRRGRHVSSSRPWIMPRKRVIRARMRRTSRKLAGHLEPTGHATPAGSGNPAAFARRARTSVSCAHSTTATAPTSTSRSGGNGSAPRRQAMQMLPRKERTGWFLPICGTRSIVG